MSPVSRGRKGKQNKRTTTRRPVALSLVGGADECDCPACTGADADPQELIDEVVAAAADVLESEDPLDAEILGAAFISIGADAGDGFEDALIDGFIPEFEALANTEALAVLLALGSVAPDESGEAALQAADRLVAAGVARPGWAAELGEPLTVGDCWHLYDSERTGSMLVCSFHRAGRSHAVMMSVDHLDCGAASDIHLLDADQIPHALEIMRSAVRPAGVEITTEALDPAEFRWQVETALDARAVHDADDPSDEDLTDASEEDDGPGYPVLAELMWARMRALPLSNKPAPPHGDEDGHGAELSLLQVLEQLAGSGGRGLSRGRTAAKLPPKRKKSNGPAPVYQLKVGLQGAKPPIWRRLEVPADMSLARLHIVIQTAFGWDDSHMHVFETPYGKFGTADADLDFRAEKPVTVEQVAPEAGSKVRYTYDFGDDWNHDILVEKILDRDPSATYPRCTGGRRAAPPEDCGGIWGYADLVEILNDPTDPEHEERLEWLGLDDAADFAPDRFDAAEVSRALSALR
jgi:Plasmid pRiA4b ORF-3-like protein